MNLTFNLKTLKRDLLSSIQELKMKFMHLTSTLKI